jgi:phosphoribosylamine--glycine ligase
MNVLVIGSGGREHAIVWKIKQSPKLKELYALPGNPGTAELAKNISEVPIHDHAAVVAFCKHKLIDLVIVGPETPLARGIADSLSAQGIPCFGPKQSAAQIEASKVFAKDFMTRYKIPTARYSAFHQLDEAIHYLETLDYPIVIKVSGLAAGKGVILPDTINEARSEISNILVDKTFGDAGKEVIIEERLAGQEISLMAFTDGTSVIPMMPAQDHKRLLDGDKGPNTGGMGAYAPVPIFTVEKMNEAVETILKPAIDGLMREGTPFVGVLYAGLMLTSDGMRVLEFNCRFGDPETQVILPLLDTDLLEIAEACVNEKLAETRIQWKKGSAICVVLASQGYPEKGESGKSVTMEMLPEDMFCYYSGVKQNETNLITSGGRVFGLTAWASDLGKAVEKVYSNIGKISFEGMQYRKDIAQRALEGKK